MKLFKYLFLLGLFLTSIVVIGQSNPEKEGFQLSGVKILDSDFNQNVEVEQGSQIFIEQIGRANQVNTNLQSEDLRLEFNQTGFDNTVNLNVAAVELNEKIIQRGAGNRVFEFNHNAQERVNLNLIQEGDNLMFERYGANSIGNKLHFVMEGSGRSLIIKNYK